MYELAIFLWISTIQNFSDFLVLYTPITKYIFEIYLSTCKTCIVGGQYTYIKPRYSSMEPVGIATPLH